MTLETEESRISSGLKTDLDRLVLSPMLRILNSLGNVLTNWARRN